MRGRCLHLALVALIFLLCHTSANARLIDEGRDEPLAPVQPPELVQVQAAPELVQVRAALLESANAEEETVDDNEQKATTRFARSTVGDRAERQVSHQVAENVERRIVAIGNDGQILQIRRPSASSANGRVSPPPPPPQARRVIFRPISQRRFRFERPSPTTTSAQATTAFPSTEATRAPSTASTSSFISAPRFLRPDPPSRGDTITVRRPSSTPSPFTVSPFRNFRPRPVQFRPQERGGRVSVSNNEIPHAATRPPPPPRLTPSVFAPPTTTFLPEQFERSSSTHFNSPSTTSSAEHSRSSPGSATPTSISTRPFSTSHSRGPVTITASRTRSGPTSQFRQPGTLRPSQLASSARLDISPSSSTFSPIHVRPLDHNPVTVEEELEEEEERHGTSTNRPPTSTTAFPTSIHSIVTPPAISTTGTRFTTSTLAHSTHSTQPPTSSTLSTLTSHPTTHTSTTQFHSSSTSTPHTSTPFITVSNQPFFTSGVAPSSTISPSSHHPSSSTAHSSTSPSTTSTHGHHSSTHGPTPPPSTLASTASSHPPTSSMSTEILHSSSGTTGGNPTVGTTIAVTEGHSSTTPVPVHTATFTDLDENFISSPQPPAPHSAEPPGSFGGAPPGELPPSDNVVDLLNEADDFMSMAHKLNIVRQARLAKRRRRMAEIRWIWKQ